LHLEDGLEDGEASSWDNPLEDDEDEADAGEDDGGDAEPDPPPKPMKSAKSATDKKGGGMPTGEGKRKPTEEVVDIEDDDEGRKADGDDSDLEYDPATKTWPANKKPPPLRKRRRPPPPPKPPKPPKPKPEPKAKPPEPKQKPKRAKDPEKYARNLELEGFHVDHEEAELVVADGNKFTAGQIKRRSNFVDGLVAHGHFAHLLDLFGGGSGDLKNGALIFIHPNERQWLSK